MSFASAFGNLFRIQELRKRLAFTLFMLAVYRVGVFVTAPGVNRTVMKKAVETSGQGFLNLFNLFTGGALEQLSIFALGIMPYVSSSIILQLLTVVVPTLEKLSKEGEMGRRKITQYTRYGTILLSLVQGFGIARYLESVRAGNESVVPDDVKGWGFRILTMLTLTAGTAFIMWLGEQITERGIGNGISLIIFAGIVARIPEAIFQTVVAQGQTAEGSDVRLLLLAAVMLAAIAFVVYVERAQRKIPVHYAKRVVGRQTFSGQSTHLPLKVNTAGVIPPIFASSILLFPATIATWIPKLKPIADAMQRGDWIYNGMYVAGIIFFAYFYTAVTFNPVDVADNLKKYGGYIPGIRPGKKTAEYIDSVLTRITFGGAMYMSAVCVLPSVLTQQMNVQFQFGGTALLIVVGVALDTVQQIESHLITRHYEGFTGPRGPRIRGRRDITPAAA